MNLKNEVAEQLVKASPPIAVSAGSVLSGVTLNNWVLIATLLYIILQAIILIRKDRRNAKADALFSERIREHRSFYERDDADE